MTGSRQRHARIAGVGYLVIFVLALHANFAVVAAAPPASDPEAMLAFARANAGALRLAILEFLVVMAADVVVALALFAVFMPAAWFLNGLSALFRLVYTIANIPVVLGLAAALRWMEAADPALAGAMVTEAIGGYGDGFTLTLGFFGVHLVLLGTLIVSTAILPRWLGVLVAIAGGGYLFDAVGMLAFPDARAGLGDIGVLLVVAPALLGEGLLMLWLLFGPVRGEGPAHKGGPGQA